MRHGYMYNGAFELNFAGLRPGTTTYKTTEGEERPLPPWPDKVDGVRVGYMEKTGKKFYAVRIQYGADDIVLENPVALDPLRHMNNRRFSPQPIQVTDDEASALIDDIIRDNPEKQPELALLINRINQTRRASRPKSAS
ncbi:MAG: hypothetical protein ACM37U_11530 [Gemmatimonas sp.]|nr:hypothetical protein [Gemmatimonadaceae bacterium]